MASLKRNLGYQTAYQILLTCLPLITAPYLARVLGAEGLGVFSYTQSIANYFVIFAELGVINYGTRSIAECRTSIQERSKVFFEIYYFQLFTSFIAVILYAAYLWFFCSNNLLIAIVQGVMIFAKLLDINWLYFGLEKFGISVVWNMIIRVVSVVAILLFVKSLNDLWIYALILSGAYLLGNLVLWIYVPSVIDWGQSKKVSISDITRHVKPNLMLFVPVLGLSLYHIMDKTMLGALSTYTETGYYYNADKVINIPVGVIAGIGTVMMPRVSSMIETGRKAESNEVFKTAVEVMFMAATAMCFGIAAIAKEFTPLFFGEGYEPCVYLIVLLSPVLIVKGLLQASRMLYLIPNRKESIYIQSVFVGAATNVIINWLLIPSYGATGAVIGTLVAETVTCVWQYVKMNRFIHCYKVLLTSLIYVVFGFFMYLLVRLVPVWASALNTVLILVMEVIVGSVSYIGLCLLYWKTSKNKILGWLIKH